jgi:hypothetical protein
MLNLNLLDLKDQNFLVKKKLSQFASPLIVVLQKFCLKIRSLSVVLFVKFLTKTKIRLYSNDAKILKKSRFICIFNCAKIPRKKNQASARFLRHKNKPTVVCFSAQNKIQPYLNLL